MKVIGIIAEYNPFHNGHKYQIERAKELSGAACVVVLMSGHYVQRGEPAIFTPQLRTEMCLKNGADLVLEIPSYFSSASARDFAGFGVSLLSRLGVDYISFGLEENNLDLLQFLAGVLNREPAVYQEALQNALSQGLSFPAARQKALLTLCRDLAPEKTEKISVLLRGPNTVLALEYLRQIQFLSSPMKPVPVLRRGAGYHDSALHPQGFSSATALRRALWEKDYVSLVSSLPENTLDLARKALPLFPDHLTGEVVRSLYEKIHKEEDLTKYLDISTELARRMYAKTKEAQDFFHLVQLFKTKQYTYTRISRALLHLFLNMTEENMAVFRSRHFQSCYAKILGFKRTSSLLLRELKKRSEIPIITKPAKAGALLGNTPALKLLKEEVYGGVLYRSLLYSLYKIRLPHPMALTPVMD